MKKNIIVKAETDSLRDVTEAVDQFLAEKACPPETQTIVDIVLEEIFINIASYAYEEGAETGNDSVEIMCEISEDGVVRLIFADNGVQYNPLEKKDPDLDASVDERQIGGLGIYMVKNMVDKITYEYIDGKNVLTIDKNFNN